MAGGRFYPDLPAVKPANWVSGLAGGMLTGMEMGTQGLKQQAIREELEQAKEGRQARQQFAETGDVNALMIDPGTWIKATEAQRNAAKDSIEFYTTKMLPHFLATDDPRTIELGLEDMKKMGVPESMLAPFRGKTLEQQKDYAMKLATMGGKIKAGILAASTPAEAEREGAIAGAKFEKATLPQLKIENELRVKLAADHDALQERLANQRDTLQRELAAAGTQDQREKLLYDYLNKAEIGIDTITAKSKERLDERTLGITSPAETERIDQVKQDYDTTAIEQKNNAIRQARTMAKQWGVPFPVEEQRLPAPRPKVGKEVKGKKGGPLKIQMQADFDKNMAKVTDPETRTKYIEGAKALGLDTSKYER